MIPKAIFGRTGHESSRLIFGGYALSQASEAEADRALELLIEYGVNHIDTAPMYGESERLIGRWMAKHRDRFFLATKARKRARDGAWQDLQRSLDRLRVDSIDLWQLHGLTGETGRLRALGPGGAIEAMLEAREKGLVRFLGVTGHTWWAPERHLASLDAFDFDSVMASYSHAFVRKLRYAEDFARLQAMCAERGVALQTIKAIARRPWGDRPRTHNTYFYEPLTDQGAIDASVHWVLGNRDVFLVTAGDLAVLSQVLGAGACFSSRPLGEEMTALAEAHGIEPIFK